MKKISIIIPVYKVENYLDKCVKSIINQTYKNLEIILVDDGSPDRCPAICDKWAEKDSRIKVIHKQNGGVSSARNCGIDVSTGDYICFVDSDDYLSETYVEDMVIGDYDIVVSGLRMINIATSKIKEYKINQKEYNNPSDFYTEVFSANCFNSPCNKLYKKDIVAETRFDTGFNIGEDAMFNIKVVAKSKTFYSVDEINYNYILGENENSLSKNENMINRFKSCYAQIKMLKNSFYKEFDPKVCCRYMVYLFCDMRSYIKKSKEPKREKLKTIKENRQNQMIVELVKNAKTNGLKQKVVKIIMKLKSTKLFYFICKMI